MMRYLAMALLMTSGTALAAPPVTATLLDGRRFDLAAERGHVVIVHFWATWCVPCRVEMPVLDAFYRRHRAQGLEMIAISADRARDRAEVVKAAHAFSFPVVAPGDARLEAFGAAKSLPETIIIGADGEIRSRLTPDRAPLTEQSLEAAVAPLLPAHDR